jgi:adenosylcobinamide-GDP ribazoletransferase
MPTPERAGPLRGLLAATTSLTRLPVGGRAGGVTEEHLRAGVPWFPAVGAAVGSIGAAIGWIVSLRAPMPVAAVVTVAAETIATGALHLDGLADTADGLGAASTGRDGLAAMRDPRVGPFGVVAVVLDLALRIAATAAVLAGSAFPLAIVGSAGAARLAPLLLARRFPYVSPDGGGRWVGEGARTPALVVAAATATAVCAFAGPAAAAAILTATSVVALAVGFVANRRFGGVTGDVFGASAELSQTVALTAVVLVAGL